MDFNLNIDDRVNIPPSVIVQRQREIEKKKELERAFSLQRRDALFILHQYHSLLLDWKRKLVPADMNIENADPLFLEALNNFDRIDAMIDELTYAGLAEQIDFIKTYDKEIEKIEKRINEFKSSGH